MPLRSAGWLSSPLRYPIGIDRLPAWLAFDNAYGLVNGQLGEPLHVTTGPANLQPLDLCERAQAKVLLVRETSKITSSRDQTMLLAAASPQREPSADGIVIALCPYQAHVEVVAR